MTAVTARPTAARPTSLFQKCKTQPGSKTISGGGLEESKILEDGLSS